MLNQVSKNQACILERFAVKYLSGKTVTVRIPADREPDCHSLMTTESLMTIESQKS